jgi:hypothetical protein
VSRFNYMNAFQPCAPIIIDVIPGVLGSGGKWSSMVEAVQRSGPRVLENRLDSKKHMELELKQACESLISTHTQLLIGPLLTFFTKVNMLCCTVL